MLNHSFTSSFKLPVAFLAALFVIGVLELSGSFLFPERYSNHEVDDLLHTLKGLKSNAQIVILGDSVGGQISRHLKNIGQYKNYRTAVLAANQAIEVTGQYFILKRYLQNNTPPKLLIFIAKNPMGMNLEQVYTENFVQRCFLKIGEILDIFFQKKDPVFTLKMIAYKFLTTFRYRLHLQQQLVGFSNTPIYSGFLPVNDKGTLKTSGTTAPVEIQSISQNYFDRLVALADKLGIRFFYIHAPMPETDYPRHEASIQAMEKHLDDLSKQYASFQYIHTIKKTLPDHYFATDRTHLSPQGLDLFTEEYRRVFARKK